MPSLPSWAACRTRVRYEQIDGTDVAFYGLDQRLDGSFVTDVDDPWDAADIRGHFPGRLGLEVGNHHGDAIARQAFAQCTADAVTAPGHDGNVDIDSHSFLAAAVGRFRSCASPQCSNILYVQEVVQCCAC